MNKDQRIYLSEQELTALIKETEGGGVVLNIEFGPSGAWLASNQLWALKKVAQWRGISTE